MAKTCRTCESCVTLIRCKRHHGYMAPDEVYECYEPRETPLLVDVLATTAKLLLEKMDNIGDGMLFNLDLLDARDILRNVLARYKEEVGDA